MIESGEVKLHFLDYWRVIKMRAGLIVLVFLLVMVTAGVTTYFLPRRYLAKVTMEVKPDDSGRTVTGRGGRAGVRSAVPAHAVSDSPEIGNPLPGRSEARPD